MINRKNSQLRKFVIRNGQSQWHRHEDLKGTPITYWIATAIKSFGHLTGAIEGRNNNNFIIIFFSNHRRRGFRFNVYNDYQEQLLS